MSSREKPSARIAAAHGRLADAVHRGVDDPDVAGLRDRLADDGLDVGVVHLLADEDDRAVLDAVVEGLLGDLAVGGDLDAVDDAGVVGRDDLAAGRGVALEAVVGRGVVRRGDHDPGVAFQVTDGEGEQGSRAELGEEVDLEPGRGEHPAQQRGELGGVVAGVAGDDARPGGVGPLRLRDVVGQAAALSPIVRSLRTLVPTGYILPRRPPVPNSSTV